MDLASVANQQNVELMEIAYAVKCVKASQESAQLIGSIIQDTAEVSKEALELYRAEQKS